MYTSLDSHTPQLSDTIQTYFQKNDIILWSAWYMYSENHIIDQIETLKKRSIKWWLTIRYAMKANPLKGILQLMHKNWVQIDACSDYEVHRAIAAWIPAEHIQITWQTRPKDLEKLINQWVRFCACSLEQLKKYWELFPGSTVWIRLNPGIGSWQFPWVNVWWHRSSFGIWHEYIDEIKNIVHTYNLEITTLHTHIGSWSDPYVWQDVAQLSLWFAKEISTIKIVDLWWWFKVSRMLDEKWADMELIWKKIAQTFDAFALETGRELHCEIEPGTFLVANSWYLWCYIDDVVDTGTEWEKFVKVTAWMSEFIRPIMYGARHPIWTNSNAWSPSKVIVVGHSCESSDMITVDNNWVALHREIAEPKIWDHVLIWWVGAYCSSMRTVHYNSYPRVAEYLLTKEGELVCLRKAESMEEVWEKDL